MKYGTPKQSADGRYYLKVSTDSPDDDRVLVQLDGVTLDSVDSSQYTVTLSSKAQEKVCHIDSQNLVSAKENCVSWFGKDLTEKTLNAAYTTTTDTDTMNVSKATVKGQVITKIFDSKNRPVDESDTPQEGRCDMILEFSGICFSKKTFSPIWKAVQIRLKSEPPKKYTDECLFVDDDPIDSGSGSDTDFF